MDADIDVSKTNVYRVTLANQAETLCDYTFTSEMAEKFYHEIRLNMNVPDASITYSPDDIQLGDLDGDGELEIVVKREPYDGANQGGWNNSPCSTWAAKRATTGPATPIFRQTAAIWTAS